MIEEPKDHNSFLKAILRFHSDSVIILNKEGIIQYRNESMNPTLGWHPKDLVGTKVFDYIHPEDLPLFQAAFHDTLSDNSSRPLVYRVMDKQGQFKWLEAEFINLLDFEGINGLVIRSRDITDKVEAEAREKENKAYYEALFFNHPNAVARWDTTGITEDINDSTVRFFGFEKAEVIGQPIMNFVDPAFATVTGEAFHKTLGGEPSFFRARGIRRDGSVMETNNIFIPVKLDGKVTKVLGITQDITQLIRANELLKEQARVQSSIFESINEAFFALDSQWRFTYVNKLGAATLRKTKEEILNKPLSAILRPLNPQFAGSLFFRKCQEVMETGRPVAFQEFFSYDKSTVSFKIYPLEDGLAVHFIDISEIITAQQELEKLSYVASKVNNGVLILDHEGSVEWTNDSFIHFTGYSLDESRGKKAGDMIIDKDQTGLEVLGKIQARIQQTRPFSENLVLRNKMGEKRWFHGDMTPVLGSTPEENKFYVILTDISQSKEAEEKLLQQADDLFQQNRDLQQFTYIVSHNLRAPVANVMGLTHILRETPKKSPDFEEILDKLEESASRLDMVIRDMNTILSVRAKSQTEEKEPVSLLEVCQQVKESLKEELAASGGNMELALDPAGVLYANKAYIYSIFYNLLINALKFRSEARVLQIRIKSYATEEGALVIEVSDNGLGMDMDKVRNDLFKLYTRFNASVEGKGLGLFLVKTQVEALGGKIEVESQPDQGTTFIIYFDSIYQSG